MVIRHSQKSSAPYWSLINGGLIFSCVRHGRDGWTRVALRSNECGKHCEVMRMADEKTYRWPRFE